MKKHYIVTVMATAGFEVEADSPDEAAAKVENMDLESVIEAFRSNGYDVTEVQEDEK